MDNKIGRNDPCSCGSGKKYKNCCLKKHQQEASQSPLARRKLTATWVNAPKGPNLMERAFGNAMESAKTFKAIKPNASDQSSQTIEDNKPSE